MAEKNNCWDNWFEAGNIQDGTYARRLQALIEIGDYSWVVLSGDEAIRVANEAIGDENLAKKTLPLSKMENRLVLASKTLGVTLKNLARNAAGVCWRKLFKVKRKSL